ncbi:MAG: response regulator [Patescibacteria group bacterium]|nr:response regulator [Patescibacteria group bacterium]
MRIVLLVEDQFFQKNALKIFLGKAGIDIIDSNTGEKALEILRSNPQIKIVVTDFNLSYGGGKMNGLDLLKQIKKDFPKTKIVVMSCDYDLKAETFLQAGAAEFLSTKNGSAILEAIKKLRP